MMWIIVAFTVLASVSASEAAERVWVDTDPACGLGATSDPDDCLAVAALALSDRIEIVGVSTVFGNAAAVATHRVASELIGQLEAETGHPIALHAGARHPGATAEPTPAVAALRQALESAPLTIVALGPLTTIANALRGRPDLAGNVKRVIAVMGKREGHVFHPSEGRRSSILFGHGPVFRDLNAALDPWAARAVFDSGVEVILAPYALARRFEVTPSDLERLSSGGPAMRWVATRTRPWLSWWREAIGRDGFYAFDLAAALLVLAPGSARCEPRPVWVDIDRLAFGGWGIAPSVLVERAPTRAGWRPPRRRMPVGTVTWCRDLRMSPMAAFNGVLADGGSWSAPVSSAPVGQPRFLFR
jgi:purine nucleosidase